MIAQARVAAYEVLSAVSAGRVDLPGALARARASLDDQRDRALVSEIATGVQRWRAALDHLIEQVSKRALDRLDPEILEILRLSAYQLLYLTRVPSAAVVDDAVHLAGRAGKRSAGGFVNAVLRTMSRQRQTLPLPPRPADPVERDGVLDYFSISLSHPRWLAARWYDRLGFDAAERWLQFDNTPAPLTLRANRRRLSREELAARLATRGVATTHGRFAPDALIVEAGEPLGDAPVEEGLLLIQDEASQLVALLAGERPGPLVLDTCASPGGKATAIAAAVREAGRVVACDLRDRRLDLLRQTIAATGTANVLVVQADLLEPLPFRVRFDCVIVDAPCSGLGTLRRDPDIRWRRRETDLPRFAAAQTRMIRHAAEVLGAGGRLVYATCSSEPEENEQVVEAFLRSSADFVPVDARQAHTALSAAVVDSSGHLRTTPDRHGLEAFFGAVLERRPT